MSSPPPYPLPPMTAALKRLPMMGENSSVGSRSGPGASVPQRFGAIVPMTQSASGTVTLKL